MSVLISRYFFVGTIDHCCDFKLVDGFGQWKSSPSHPHIPQCPQVSANTDLTGWICSGWGLGLSKKRTHFQHFPNIPIIRSCKTLLHSWWRQTASPSYHPDWIPHFRSKTRCFMCWGLRPVQPLVLGIRWYTGYTQFVVQTNKMT